MLRNASANSDPVRNPAREVAKEVNSNGPDCPRFSGPRFPRKSSRSGAAPCHDHLIGPGWNLAGAIHNPDHDLVSPSLGPQTIVSAFAVFLALALRPPSCYMAWFRYSSVACYEAAPSFPFRYVPRRSAVLLARDWVMSDSVHPTKSRKLVEAAIRAGASPWIDSIALIK